MQRTVWIPEMLIRKIIIMRLMTHGYMLTFTREQALDFITRRPYITWKLTNFLTNDKNDVLDIKSATQLERSFTGGTLNNFIVTIK